MVGAALALPWLNPISLGPTAAMVQLLFTGFCVSLALLCLAWRFDTHKNTDDLALQAAQAWLLAALVSCLMALLQFLGLTGELAPWVNPTQVGEAFANLRQRNQFASLVNIGLAALIGIVSWQTTRAIDHASALRARSWWPLFAAILLGVGNAASSSRTGLLQLLALTLSMWAWGRMLDPQIRRIFRCVFASYIAATFLLPALIGADLGDAGMLSRLHLDGQACSSRLILWRNVIELIALRPLAGWGWGELDYAHFVTLYPAVTQGRFCEILDNAHNLPLHLAVELGVPLALFVCGLLGWLVIRARPWGERDATRQMAWGVLLVIGLHSLLEYPLWYGPFQLAACLSLALLWLTPKHLSITSTKELMRRPRASTTAADAPPLCGKARIGIVGAAVVLLASVAYAGWDYRRIMQIYLNPVERAEPYRRNTLEKIGDSWLFSHQVQFAALTITQLTPENAADVNAKAHALLHFSPEPRVVEKLIQSARMLGRDAEAAYFETRYQAAFPATYPAAYQRLQQSSP